MGFATRLGLETNEATEGSGVSVQPITTKGFITLGI